MGGDGDITVTITPTKAMADRKSILSDKENLSDMIPIMYGDSELIHMEKVKIIPKALPIISAGSRSRVNALMIPEKELIKKPNTINSGIRIGLNPAYIKNRHTTSIEKMIIRLVFRPILSDRLPII